MQKNKFVYLGDCFMKRFIFVFLIVLSMIIIFGSCSKEKNYKAEIYDLNGTWQPDFIYRGSQKQTEEKRKLPKEVFSWGEGEYIPNATFNIDITSEKPFILEPGLGLFPVTEITQVGMNSIKVNAFRASDFDPKIGFSIEFIFHFIDKDTIWIENKEIDSILYRKSELWHRLSGPTP